MVVDKRVEKGLNILKSRFNKGVVAEGAIDSVDETIDSIINTAIALIGD